eukprot:gene24243-30562_t
MEVSCRSGDSSEFSPPSSPTNNKNNVSQREISVPTSSVTYTKQTAVAAPVSAVKTTPSIVTTGGNKKKGLKLGNKAEMISSDTLELAMALVILNICIYGVYTAAPHLLLRKVLCVAIANVVVAHTLQLRAARVVTAVAVAVSAAKAEALAASSVLVSSTKTPPQDGSPNVGSVQTVAASQQSSPELSVVAAKKGSGKPTPGFTFTEVQTEPRLSTAHTWCRVDHRQFNVRVGPEYSRYKKKAPSGPPIYEPFAVDVFCTKLRVDHAATRFQLPDTSHINTHNEFVPPIVIVQIQIPSEPPTSIFSSAEDGPGWAIVMYYRISEDACNQLKDLSTASPAVKLFAEWCEKAPVDAAWRGRFKVINSCTNLEELGMPSAIVAYNAKPVLIRRTGTIFRGPNYLEMNIHVHKFANLAKQSIYLISSRCGLMFMQIGFVIEGRDDKELPEAMFACVAVNKPQEDQAEFIFEEEE